MLKKREKKRSVMNQNYISKWVHAFDTHCKYENCFYKQEHVFLIFPGKYFHRRNPSTKVWYERFWGHSSCREPDAKQHSQMPELKLVRYCQSMIHWSPGIVIIHVLISKIDITAFLVLVIWILFYSVHQNEWHILLQKIFLSWSYYINIYLYLIIKIINQKKVQTSRQTILFSTATE